MVPLKDVHITSVAILHELLTRIGWSLPEKNSRIITQSYLLKVRDKKVYGLRQSDVVWAECTRPPSVAILTAKLEQYLQPLGVPSGINALK